MLTSVSISVFRGFIDNFHRTKFPAIQYVVLVPVPHLMQMPYHLQKSEKRVARTQLLVISSLRMLVKNLVS